MKSNIKAKFLQHLSGKKSNGGFTLIELLVVIIIIGILTAIALPSFLNQSNKAKLTEAKNTVRSASESQKAFYVENSEFIETDNFDDLKDRNLIPDDVPAYDEGGWLEALGVAVDGIVTKNYIYEQTPESFAGLTIHAYPRGRDTDTFGAGNPDAAHKAYIGGLNVVRGIVDQVYCEAVESPAENADAPTGEEVATLAQGEPVLCPDQENWRSTKDEDQG